MDNDNQWTDESLTGMEEPKHLGVTEHFLIFIGLVFGAGCILLCLFVITHISNILSNYEPLLAFIDFVATGLRSSLIFSIVVTVILGGCSFLCFVMTMKVMERR